jgi:hypothetical protein
LASPAQRSTIKALGVDVFIASSEHIKRRIKRILSSRFDRDLPEYVETEQFLATPSLRGVIIIWF